MGSGVGGREPRAVVTWMVGVSAVVGLSACGPPTSTPVAEQPSSPTASITVEPELPAGSPDPGALAGFACGPDASGSWTATGMLTNTDPAPAVYVVTVVVSGPDSAGAQAKRQLVTLRSGASEPVEIGTLPLPAEGELSCQAQVVRRP